MGRLKEERIEPGSLEIENVHAVKLVYEDEEEILDASTPVNVTAPVPQRQLTWPRLRLQTITLMAAILAVTLGASYVLSRNRHQPPPATAPPLNSIAVLPLTNLTRDNDEDYF